MNQTLKLIVFSTLVSGMSTAVTAEQVHEHDYHEKNQATMIKQQQDEGEDHDGHEQDKGHGYEGYEEGIVLSPKQVEFANIKVEILKARKMDYQIYAPGEIKANGYTSYLVSPRADSIVLRRHAALGDYVEMEQPLVTLFSETIAEAQAIFRVASSEWRRAQNLGRKVVSGKRFISAETAYEAAYGRLLAFGLSEEAIQSLVKKPQALGEYTLIAASAGVVLSDDFHQGQRLESGEALMELADEHELWVEARLAPTAQLELPAGTEAQVKVGSEWFTAKVVQEAHTIDLKTRTRVVRLLVNNDAHRLHPGLFADVFFSFVSEEPVLAVPETALMRSANGDWTVFVEDEPGQFKAQKVTLGHSIGRWREILGIHPDSRVVMEGAFFVASQIAKGGFDPHNH